MSYLPPVVQILLLLLVVSAAAFDLRQRRIPNWLNLSSVVVGFGLNSFLYAPFGDLFSADGLWFSAKGLGLALLIFFPLYLVRGTGAGDVKLMGAVGAIVGPWNWLAIFILSSILGGIAAVVLLTSKGRLGRTLRNIGFMLNELAHLRPPYARRGELDVSSRQALTLPRGLVVALGTVIFLIITFIWAPR